MSGTDERLHDQIRPARTPAEAPAEAPVGGQVTTSAPSTFSQHSINLTHLAFSANEMTLGYAENNTDTGGILTVSNGGQAANIALLGNYMAASFATAPDGHGGTLVTEAADAQNPRLHTRIQRNQSPVASSWCDRLTAGEWLQYSSQKI